MRMANGWKELTTELQISWHEIVGELMGLQYRY
jgi:hypothetical protein